jgi:hypothetical protein
MKIFFPRAALSFHEDGKTGALSLRGYFIFLASHDRTPEEYL